MYVRQFGYKVVPGREEKAAALCSQFVDALRERGVRAHVRIGIKPDTTLQVVEEYLSLASMQATRAALECDESYRSAITVWATEFYPLVQAASPAVVMHEQQLAA